MLKKLFGIGFVVSLLSMALVGFAQEDAACMVSVPEESVEIDFIGWTFPITEIYREQLEMCNQVENISVNTQMFDSASAKENMALALSAGGDSPYEIVHVDDASIVEYASEEWLMPLGDLIEQYGEEYNLDGIPQTLYDSATYQDEVYGIPIIANTMHLFYRSDLLEEYGLDVPETYDDVINACGVLSEEESIDLPFTINLHAGWAWRIEFHNFLGSYGGEWLNEDSTPAFNSEAGVAAVKKMLEVVDACMGPEGLTYSIDVSQQALQDGDLAMALTWASRAATMDDEMMTSPDVLGLIEFAPAPRANPDGAYSGPAATDFYAIPANVTVDPEIIFEVIMEAADAESQAQAVAQGIVSRTEVAQGGDGGRNLEAASTTISEGVGSYGTDPAVGIAQNAIANTLPNAADLDLSAEDIDAQIQALLDEAAESYIQEATAQGYITE